MIKLLLHAAGTARRAGPSRRAIVAQGTAFERLEARQLLAVVTWDGGGDGRSWEDPLNWSADVLPGTADDARIGSGSNEIVLSSGTGVRSLLADRPVRVTGGTLFSAGDLSFGRGLELSQPAVLLAEGRVQMAGSSQRIVTIAGTIRAQAILLDVGGESVLAITGRLEAWSPSGHGGRIEALGQRVVVDGSALLDASGALGGGEILIGGDYQGGGVLRRADVTYIGEHAMLRADATDSGQGGRVIVWSETVTGFYGKISVRGGDRWGDGGFVETSGKVALDCTGEVDAIAPAGAAGTWLLDPRNVTIAAATTAGGSFSGGNPNTFTPIADNAVVNVATIISALGSGAAVIITTGASGGQAGSITVNAPINVTAGLPGRLTLRAADDININASITISGTLVQGLDLFANDPAGDTDPTSGDVTFAVNVNVSIGNGSLVITGVNLTLSTGTIGASSVTATMTGNVTVNGDISGSSSITLRSGTDGTGNMSFGAAGIDLNSANITLRAGDGPVGGGTVAAVDLITNSPTFHGAAGGATRPTAFTYQQDARIIDADIPAAARFAASISSMDYTIESDDSSVTVSTASKINGADLRLNSAANTNMNAPMTFGQLSVVADLDENGAGSALFNASCSVSSFIVAGAAINVAAGVTIGSTNNIFAFSTGTTTVAGILDAIEGVLTITAQTIVLSGTLESNNFIQLAVGTGGVAQNGGGVLTDQLLVFSTGPIDLDGSNNINTVAFTAAGDATFNNLDAFMVDQLTGEVTVTGAHSTGITTLSAATGSITINRPVTAEIRVVLNAPGGATTTVSGVVNSIALLLLGGGPTGQYALTTDVQSIASSAAAALVITDANALFVAQVGSVIGINTSGRPVTLTAGGTAGITLQAPLNVGSSTVQFNSAGAVSQTSGAITASGLLMLGAGSYSLTSPTNNVAIVAAGVGFGFVSYTDADALVVGTVLGTSGMNNRTSGVTVVAGASLSVLSTVGASAGNILLRSGSAGTGNLTFGAGGVSVLGASISLIAGNGLGGPATAAVDTATNSPTFRGAGGGATNPTSFLLRQDASISDAAVPLTTRFGASTVAGLNYTLQSDDGTLTITTASKVNGSSLSVASATGTTINSGLNLLSLSAGGPVTLNAATLTTTNTASFGGSVTLLTNVTITCTNLSFNGIVTGSGGDRSLIATASGSTVFGAGSNLGTLTVNGGGSTAIGADMTTTGDQTYSEAVSLLDSATISAGGRLSFAATLLAGANNAFLAGGEIDFLGGANSVVGAGVLQLAPGAAAGSIVLTAGGDLPGQLDITATDRAAIADGFSTLIFGRVDGSGVVTVATPYVARDPVIFRAPAAPGRIIVNAALTTAPGSNGSYTFVGSGSTVILNADVRTNGQPIVFNDSVQIGVPLVTIDTTGNGAVPAGADIQFLFSLGSETGEGNSLTLLGGTAGATLFTGPVGVPSGTALGTLTTDAGGLTRILNAMRATTHLYNDAVRVEGDAIFTGNQMTFQQALNALGAGIDIGFVGSGVNPALFWNAPVGQIGAPSSIIINTPVVTTINTGAVSTSSMQFYHGPVVLGASVTMTSIQVSIDSGLTGNGRNLTINSAGASTLGGVIAGLATLTTNSGGSTTLAGPSIAATGNIVFGDSVQITGGLTITTLANLVFASTINSGANDFTLQAAEIDFLGGVSGSGTVTLLQSNLSQPFNIAHATEGGGDAMDITAAELDQFGSGFEQLKFGLEGGASIMSVEEYTFDSSIELTMNGEGGQIQLMGNVTAAGDNDNIGIRGNGSTTHLHGSLITHGGSITIEDSVIVEVGGVVIDSTAGGTRPGGPIFVHRRINSAIGQGRPLLIRAGISSIQLDGPVGDMTGGELGTLELHGAGGITLNSTYVRTVGFQLYTGQVTLGPSVTIQTQGAPVTFNDAVGGQSNLIIGPGTGTVTFGGSLGGVTSLASLTINAGSTRIFQGAVNVGVLTVFGGNVVFNGATNIVTGLLIAGNLGGSGTVSFDLPLTWVGGDMVGAGTTVIRQTGALVISGGPKTLSRQIENRGTTYWTDGNVNFAGGSFVNMPQGQFVAQSQGAFTGVSGVNSFDNRGYFERSAPAGGGGAGTASLANLQVTNSGVIAMIDGNLNVVAAGPGATFVNSGQIDLSAGTLLNVTGSLLLTATSRVDTVIAGQAFLGRINVSGTASLDGAFGLTMGNDFVPTRGSVISIITAGTVTGTYAQTEFPPIFATRVYPRYDPAAFSLLFTAPADFNGDGLLNPDDLSEFITAFFLELMFPGTIPQADFNGDGLVNPDDLSEFITAFFLG